MRTIGIVVSRFNEEYTEALLQSALAELHGHSVSIVRVPGAYEIPLQVQRLARSKKFDAVIALGVICGSINGYLIGYLRLRAFLTTLVTLIIFRSVYDILFLKMSTAIVAGSNGARM